MRNKIAILFISLGVMLAAAGLLQGEFSRVKGLGIRICFECMGLGG